MNRLFSTLVDAQKTRRGRPSSDVADLHQHLDHDVDFTLKNGDAAPPLTGHH